MAALNGGEIINIVSCFDVPELPIEKMSAKKNGFDIHILDSNAYNQAFSSMQCTSARKTIVWNYIFPANAPVFTQPKEKLIYFLWEPWPVDISYYAFYSKVYTYNDALVDGKKFFKFYYPSWRPMTASVPSFKEKKFCTLVASNWTSDRVNMINFFETKPCGEFEFYSFNSYNSKMYKGAIPGGHSGEEKISVLKNYRFCVCFENTSHLKGYITEKIFICFASGCVPIYLGAPNVEEYIPKNCYVDYRDFQNLEELYQYLKNMPEELYNQYIAHIRTYLQGEKAQLFTPENFDKILSDAITTEISPDN